MELLPAFVSMKKARFLFGLMAAAIMMMATPFYIDSTMLGITLVSAFSSSAGHTTVTRHGKNRVERSTWNHPCKTRVSPQGVKIMDDPAKRRKPTFSLCSLLEKEETSSSSKYSEEIHVDMNADKDVRGKVESLTERKVMLVSLPPMTIMDKITSDGDESSSSKSSYDEFDPSLLRRVWEWKDWALGDGRDYFIPRPKALRTLNSNLVGQSTTTTTTTNHHNSNNTVHPLDSANSIPITTTITIDECGVLSNCARMDVVLVLNVTTTTITASSSLETEQKSWMNSTQVSMVEQAVRHMVARCVAQQLAVYESNNQQKQQAFFLDWPDHRVVEEMVQHTNSQDHTDCVVVQGLGNAWVVVEGLAEVARHFCVVAAGMAPRPSRPDREVEFRPFSSRDAHILLQLKRSSESVMGTIGDNSCAPRISSLLFQAALTAGKAARDPQRVPSIAALRGYAMESKRYSQRAPPKLESLAIQAVEELAIEPAVERCVGRWNAMDASSSISQLTSRVKQTFVVTTEKDRRLVRQMLHEPIMALREGRSINETLVCLQIQEKLVTTT